MSEKNFQVLYLMEARFLSWRYHEGKHHSLILSATQPLQQLRTGP